MRLSRLADSRRWNELDASDLPRAVHDLLIRAAGRPNAFPLSPKNFAYRAVQETIRDGLEDGMKSSAKPTKRPSTQLH